MYATDYRNVDGFIFPTTRRPYAGEADDQVVIVAIDMAEITTRLTSRPGARYQMSAPPRVRLSLRRHRVQRPSVGPHRAPPVRALVRERPARRRPDPGSWNEPAAPRAAGSGLSGPYGLLLGAPLPRLTWPGCILVSSASAASVPWSPRPWPGSASSGSPCWTSTPSRQLPRPASSCQPRDARLARAKVEVLAGPCGAPRPLRTPGSRDWSCRSPTRAWPPPWIATCCSAASTVPGPVPCSTWPLTPTWYPSLMAGSCSAGGRGKRLECPGPYEAVLATVERTGLLDDPSTWPALARTTRSAEGNVFPFSAAAAAGETFDCSAR